MTSTVKTTDHNATYVHISTSNSTRSHNKNNNYYFIFQSTRKYDWKGMRRRRRRRAGWRGGWRLTYHILPVFSAISKLSPSEHKQILWTCSTTINDLLFHFPFCSQWPRSRRLNEKRKEGKWVFNIHSQFGPGGGDISLKRWPIISCQCHCEPQTPSHRWK